MPRLVQRDPFELVPERLLQDDRHPIQRDRVDRSVIRIFDAWADSAEVKPVLGRIQRDRGRPDFDLYLHCWTTAQPSEEWDTWIPPV